MTKLTTWCAIIFMLTSITLSIMGSKKIGTGGSVLSGQKPAQQSQPAKK
jgi:preprotein translocase subunit SecG